MADITRRRQGEILEALFDILTDHPDGLQAKDAIQEVEKRLVLTDFERSDYPDKPGIRRFDKTVRFSTIASVKTGWVVKSKGTWLLTDDGKAALKEFSDPEDLMRQSMRLYKVWKKAQPREDALGGDDAGIVDDDVVVASITLEEAEETARQEIRAYLAKMPPYDFQELVATLLRAMNYHVAWVAPPGPVRGLDILAYTDPLGATGPRIKVQVKRRADKIAVQEARSFMAILSATDVGIFISTGGFTPDAQTEARHQEKPASDTHRPRRTHLTSGSRTTTASLRLSGNVFLSSRSFTSLREHPGALFAGCRPEGRPDGVTVGALLRGTGRTARGLGSCGPQLTVGARRKA